MHPMNSWDANKFARQHREGERVKMNKSEPKMRLSKGERATTNSHCHLIIRLNKVLGREAQIFNNDDGDDELGNQIW